MSIFTRAIKPAWQQPKTAWDRLEAEDLKNVTLEDCINASKEGYRAVIFGGELVGFKYEGALLGHKQLCGPFDTEEKAIRKGIELFGDDNFNVIEVEIDN